MIFNIINKDNIHLLKKFIKLNTSNFFRYYKNRKISIIKNHLITIVLTNNDDIIGYGHIDYEKKYWLGLCILEKHRSNGYGKAILNYLINFVKDNKIIAIHLSVDKNNIIAKNIYDKFGFKIIKDNEKIYIMKKDINI